MLQSEWNRKRDERKAEADKVVAQEAEEAKQALVDYRKQQVATATGAGAPEGTEESGPYDGLTNDELSDILKERELPHSGTKQELLDRLAESDAEKSGTE
jgi:hypothetical protein